jgi:hypothetical protein
MSRTFEPKLASVRGCEARLCAAPEFSRWLDKSKPGDRIVYAEAQWLPKEVAAPVLGLVRAGHDAGSVLLVQQRLAPGWFRYIAVRRQLRLRPITRFTARGAA